MKNSQISFTSKIQIVDDAAFISAVNGFRSKISANKPWTWKEITPRVPQAYANEVKDCVAGGIITEPANGIRDVVMFHITSKDSENDNFTLIEEAISDKLSGAKPCRGLLVGSKDYYGSKSVNLFKMFEDFMRKLGIPVSNLCANCRQKFLLSFKNPLRLYDRSCSKCGMAIQTTYAPDRPETVYCEKCYLAAVY